MIGKIGKSILFDPKKWGAIGGDLDAPLFYENLIHRHPEINFYILGKSDFASCAPAIRNRLNKHGNIFDMYDGAAEYVKDNWERLTDYYKDKYEGVNLGQYSKAKGMFEYITDVQLERLPKMDGAVLFSGPDGTSNLPDMVALSRNPDTISSPLVSLIGYTGPTYHYLNKTKLPYVLLVTDPRYYPPRGNDLMHTASKVISQYNYTANHNHYTTYTNVNKIHHKIPVTYDALETIFLIGKEKTAGSSSLVDFFDNNPEDNKKLTIILNEGRPSRYKMLHQYILSKITDVAIYGKWTHPATKTDSRFKGPKHFADLESILKDTKYTFIIPIKKGWVTAKFWEMIQYDVIPFMHPSYDTQNNLKCPDFIRVKSAQEMLEKIDFLENNQDEYDKLLNELRNMLKPEFYSGEHLDTITINALKEIGVL